MNTVIKSGPNDFCMAHIKCFKTYEVLEVQKSFFQLPLEKTARKWRKNALKNFEFIPHAWQVITHDISSYTYKKMRRKIPYRERQRCGFFKPTDTVFKAWEETKKIAQILRACYVLFRTPETFNENRKNIENMNRFFGQIDRGGITPIWDNSGKWEDRTVREICKNNKIIHAVDPFKSKQLYGDISYFRLKGLKGRKYQFTFEDYKKIKKFCSKKTNYVMFCNSNRKNDCLEFLKQLPALPDK